MHRLKPLRRMILGVNEITCKMKTNCYQMSNKIKLNENGDIDKHKLHLINGKRIPLKLRDKVIQLIPYTTRKL